jgi:hypothetical protein
MPRGAGAGIAPYLNGACVRLRAELNVCPLRLGTLLVAKGSGHRAGNFGGGGARDGSGSIWVPFTAHLRFSNGRHPRLQFPRLRWAKPLPR